MTEVQVYGYRDVTVSHKDIGEGWRKLPVFNYISPVQFAYEEWWLRNIANTTCYTYVYREGGADYFAANNQKGVRPLILIG